MVSYGPLFATQFVYLFYKFSLDILILVTMAFSADLNLQPSESNSNITEDKCSICLSSIEQPAFPDGCLHSFCFVCLREWTLARVPAECPLCKTPIRVIHYNVRSPDRFQSFIVSSSRPPRSLSSDPPPPPPPHPQPPLSILTGIPRYDPVTGFFGLPVVTYVYYFVRIFDRMGKIQSHIY